jgi:hypothetical protein
MDKPSASVADARVDQLWATLDTRKQGQLDLPALKKGLRKLDHRRTGHAVSMSLALSGYCSFEECRPTAGRGDEGCRYRRQWKNHLQWYAVLSHVLVTVDRY